MSIATQITRLNNNIEAMKNTKQQIKDAVNNDFDIIANEQIENYDTLIENGLELYKQYIPPVETNQATDIQVTDAMKCNSNKLELFGNTEQASYTGKNLLKIDTDFPSANKRGITNIYDSATGKNSFSGTATGDYPWISSAEINTIPQGTTLTFSMLKTLTYKVYARLYYDATNYETITIESGDLSATKTLQHDITRVAILLQILSRTTINEELYLQIEQGSTATNFEIYTGGQPSPNPDYPQDIHVVSGNNTISVGNTDYPINLGSLELCKIGDYQDYLYKENGNWYKYNAIEKFVLDGTEAWVKGSKSTVNRYAARYIFQNKKTISNYQSIDILSQHFIAITPEQSDGASVIGICKYNDLGIMINFDLNDSDFDTLNKFLSWLTNNNSKLYYVLGTPTSTQITDETLISQLDAIYNHLALVKGTNHITVTASDLAPYMKLSYKNYELTSNE